MPPPTRRHPPRPSAHRPSRWKAAILAVTLVFPLGSGPADAAFPGHNGKIAFVKGVPRHPGAGRHDQIFVMSPRGARPQQLTTGGVNRYPTWSPDGTRILYVHRGTARADELRVMDTRGDLLQRGLRVRHGHIVDTAWSPDGDHVALVRWRGPVSQILVYSFADGDTTRLPFQDARGRVPYQVAWSPDGEDLAISAITPEGEDSRGELFLLRPDGTDPRRITFSPHVLEIMPDWSPDSRRLVYWALHPGGRCETPVMVVRRDGSAEHRVSGCNTSTPAWSPDGQRIVVGASRHGKAGLWTMSPRGTRAQFLTRTGWSPDWQPLPDTAPRQR